MNHEQEEDNEVYKEVSIRVGTKKVIQKLFIPDGNYY